MRIRPARYLTWMVITGLVLAGCGNHESSSGHNASGDPAGDSTQEPVLPASSGAPILLYTDVLSGPGSGGELDLGMYLTVFGKNFGSGTPGSNIKVFIGDVEVARYLGGIGTSRGRGDIQQLAVQIGALGNPSPGVALPVKVVVDGLTSNSNIDFTIQPGRMFYLDNVDGNDASGVAGDIGKPFRHVQTGCGGNDGVLSANNIRAGDVIVLRDRGQPWSDLGCDRRFARMRYITGSAPTGQANTGPITILGYPGETVNLQPPAVAYTSDGNGHYIVANADRVYGGIHGMNGQDAYSDWITIANLRIAGGDWTVGDAPINLQTDANHWRIINNELHDWIAADASIYYKDSVVAANLLEAKSGAISGNGKNVRILGNHIYNFTGTQHNHCIYIDSFADDVEIAYNHVHDCRGGNIIQTYDSTGMSDGSSIITSIAIHHNALHDGHRYGLNFGNGTRSARAWNNLIYNTDFAGVRFDVSDAQGDFRIVHNTVYNSNRVSGGASAIIEDSWCLWCSAGVEIRHNIFVPGGTAAYYVALNHDGAPTWPPASLQIQRNAWFGLSSAVPVEDSSPISADPVLMDADHADFRLGTGSAAIGQGTAELSFAVTTDYAVNSRPAGASDLGALQTQ